MCRSTTHLSKHAILPNIQLIWQPYIMFNFMGKMANIENKGTSSFHFYLSDLKGKIGMYWYVDNSSVQNSNCT